jgi:two-component system OmpR family sensor kinase
MTGVLSSLPLARRLPLIAAAVAFAVALGTTEAAFLAARVAGGDASRTWWLLFAADLTLAGAGAVLAAVLVRRALRPFLPLGRALARAGAGVLRPIPQAELPPAGTEAGRLAAAFNQMAGHLAAREAEAARLAEREREALLGRLAATVAHEVRNPLAGMLTAVETARRFGEDRAARAEALDLIARGLRQIEAVVDATLATHRAGDGPRLLAPEDLADLRALVAPEARRRGVTLAWGIALAEPFPADGVAVRQAVLNLLLNAVAASPEGGQVRLSAGPGAGGALVIEVADEAGGLPDAAAARLAGRRGEGPGLGLEVVMAQMERLRGRITVDRAPRHGTLIRLTLPRGAA